MRVEAYMPEVPAESTEVRMTAFITLAAKAMPAFLKMRVKGLTPMSVTSLLSRFGSV